MSYGLWSRRCTAHPRWSDLEDASGLGFTKHCRNHLALWWRSCTSPERCAAVEPARCVLRSKTAKCRYKALKVAVWIGQNNPNAEQSGRWLRATLTQPWCRKHWCVSWLGENGFGPIPGKYHMERGGLNSWLRQKAAQTGAVRSLFSVNKTRSPAVPLVSVAAGGAQVTTKH